MTEAGPEEALLAAVREMARARRALVAAARRLGVEVPGRRPDGAMAADREAVLEFLRGRGPARRREVMEFTGLRWTLVDTALAGLVSEGRAVRLREGVYAAVEGGGDERERGAGRTDGAGDRRPAGGLAPAREVSDGDGGVPVGVPGLGLVGGVRAGEEVSGAADGADAPAGGDRPGGDLPGKLKLSDERDDDGAGDPAGGPGVLDDLHGDVLSPDAEAMAQANRIRREAVDAMLAAAQRRIARSEGAVVDRETGDVPVYVPGMSEPSTPRPPERHAWGDGYERIEEEGDG